MFQKPFITLYDRVKRTVKKVGESAKNFFNDMLDELDYDETKFKKSKTYLTRFKYPLKYDKRFKSINNYLIKILTYQGFSSERTMLIKIENTDIIKSMTYQVEKSVEFYDKKQEAFARQYLKTEIVYGLITINFNFEDETIETIIFLDIKNHRIKQLNLNLFDKLEKATDLIADHLKTKIR